MTQLVIKAMSGASFSSTSQLVVLAPGSLCPTLSIFALRLSVAPTIEITAGTCTLLTDQHSQIASGLSPRQLCA